MAQGDVVVFAKAKERIGDAEIDLSDGATNKFRLGLSNGTTTPDETGSSDPTWGAVGTPDFQSEEVTINSPLGSYTADGKSVSDTITDNWSLSGPTCKFDGDDVSWPQDPQNPADARYGILFHDVGSKYCLLYLDLGATFDMSGGDLSVTWDTGGIFTLA